MIHFKPKACDRPFLALFQRDLLFAYQKVDKQLANMVLKYFVEHGSQWLSPKNVALTLFSNIPPLSLEAVKTSSSLPVAIDARAQMKCRAARLKIFFNTQFQNVPCVTYSDIIPARFWKSIDDNNRATERANKEAKKCDSRSGF